MLPTFKSAQPNWSALRFAAYGLLALAIGFVLAAATSGGADPVLANTPVVLGVVEERPETTTAETPVPDTSVVDTVAPLTSTSTTSTTSSSSTSSSIPSSTTVAPAAPAATTSTSTTSTTTTTTTTTKTTSVAPKSIGEQAEAILDFPWRERFPNWTLVWAENKSGVRALTFPDRKVIEMYVRPGDNPTFLARVLAHELGHVADIELNDDADRARWREVRGIPDTVYWWPQGDSYDFDTGAGDFAEGFATLLVGSETKSRVAGAPTAAQLAVMAELIG